MFLFNWNVVYCLVVVAASCGWMTGEMGSIDWFAWLLICWSYCENVKVFITVSYIFKCELVVELKFEDQQIELFCMLSSKVHHSLSLYFISLNCLSVDVCSVVQLNAKHRWWSYIERVMSVVIVLRMSDLWCLIDNLLAYTYQLYFLN